jgi:hypothetical protein
MENENEDLEKIAQAIISASNKDDEACKIAKYYIDLRRSTLDSEEIDTIVDKVLSIENYLREWIKNNPNDNSTMMQPEEKAMGFINDLRKRGLLN